MFKTLFKREKPTQQDNPNPPSSEKLSLIDKCCNVVLNLAQKTTEILAFIIFILCLTMAGALYIYGIYYFVTGVIFQAILTNQWDLVISNSLHFIEIILIAMLVSLLAPTTFRFYRYCALGETQKLKEVDLGIVERWIGSILITIIASVLLEKLMGKADVSIYTYIGGTLTIFALGIFIHIMQEKN